MLAPVRKEEPVNRLVIDVPTMYADHHVTEVRRLLLEDSCVATVNASSAFHVVEVNFDPEKTSEDALREKLDAAGYTAELDVPLESGQPAVCRDGDAYFRHTAAYESVGTVLSFGQEIVSTGRPLWPCPGMTPAPAIDE
jgi:copper chaperone CopZ